jgi:hypothetical protein
MATRPRILGKDMALPARDLRLRLPLPGKPLHLIQHPRSFSFFPFLSVGQVQVAVKADNVRVEPDGLLKFCHRLVVFTLSGVNDPQIIVSMRIRGINGNGLF